MTILGKGNTTLSREIVIRGGATILSTKDKAKDH